MGEFCEFAGELVEFGVVEIIFGGGVAVWAVFGEKMLARIFDGLLEAESRVVSATVRISALQGVVDTGAAIGSDDDAVIDSMEFGRIGRAVAEDGV